MESARRATPERSATPEEVAATYFQAWRNGDIDSVRSLLHPDVDFAGALGSTHGAAETASGLVPSPPFGGSEVSMAGCSPGSLALTRG